MQRTQHRRRGDVSSTKEIQINQSQLGSATELSCSLPAHTAGLNTPAKFSRSAWFNVYIICVLSSIMITVVIGLLNLRQCDVHSPTVAEVNLSN